MNKHAKQLILLVAITLLIALLCACNSDTATETPTAPETTPPQENTAATTTPTQPPIDADNADSTDTSDVPSVVSGELIIALDYEKISGSASNQYAIWIEDMDGNYVSTVFATQWTAQGGYITRPDSIAMWAAKSDIASMPDYYVDAVSGATPQAGAQSYAWGLKDIDGNTVSPGDYRFFVEGTLRWKNYVLFSGIITIGDAPATVQAEAEYVYEGSDRFDALTSDSPENAMIGAVTASFVPAEK